MLQPRDLQFLNNIVTYYASSMIERMAYEGDMPINGNITFSEIKRATGRERLSGVIISTYVDYLTRSGVKAVCCMETQSIAIYIDSVFNLNLGPHEALRAANSLREYRQYREHQH